MKKLVIMLLAVLSLSAIVYVDGQERQLLTQTATPLTFMPLRADSYIIYVRVAHCEAGYPAGSASLTVLDKTVDIAPMSCGSPANAWQQYLICNASRYDASSNHLINDGTCRQFTGTNLTINYQGYGSVLTNVTLHSFWNAGPYMDRCSGPSQCGEVFS